MCAGRLAAWERPNAGEVRVLPWPVLSAAMDKTPRPLTQVHAPPLGDARNLHRRSVANPSELPIVIIAVACD